MNESPKKQAAEVVGEDRSQREEYAKRFRMTDRSWLAVAYPEAVHFEENGEWVEIDNRLEKKAVESSVPAVPEKGQQKTGEKTEKTIENAYVNTRNRFGVTLPVELDESRWIGVSDHGHSLYFRVDGISPSAGRVEEEPEKTGDALMDAIRVHLTGSLLYPEVLPGVDLRYVVNGQKLKENFIFSSLESVPEQLSYVVWAEGMHAKAMEDGSVLFLSEEEPTFLLPAPFLMDADGLSGGKVAVELEELEQSLYRLLYTPERGWLEAEGRAWPITLDPVIHYTSGSTDTQDTFISSGFPTAKFNQETYLRTGYFRTNYENYGKTRALIKYPTLPSLGSGDVITKAILEVRGVPTTSSVNTYTQVNAHAVTGSWVSTNVTWSTRPSYEERILDFQRVDKTAYKFYQWDVTDSVQRWYNGDAAQEGALTNQGFALVSPAEDGTAVQYALFDSSEGSYLPVLLLEYRNTTGLEPYWDYTKASAGRAGTVYVHNYTGNVVVSRTDMSYSGNRMPAAITFTYNQNDTTVNIGYGLGWRSSYSQIVEYSPVGTVEYYRWTDGDGTRIYFSLVGGQWIDEAGQGYVLTRHFSGSSIVGYSIADRDNNVLNFDANGRLTSTTDKLGNSLSVTYTQSNSSNLRISKVTDGAGRVYSFNYSSNLLSSVQYKGAGSSVLETVSYTYSGSRLTAVTYADGKSANYTFNEQKISRAKDIMRDNNTRSEVQVSFPDNSVKATGLTYNDGGTTISSASFVYGDHFTTVTDNNNRWCTYHFNNDGNTTSVYNQAGQAMYGRYAADESSSGKANQLLQRSRLQDTVVNLLSLRVRSGDWSNTKTVQEGKTYTLSGTGDAGTTMNLTSGGVTKTAVSISSAVRTEVTLTIPSGATSMTLHGSGTFTDMQLELTEAANRYNMLYNTDMNSLYDWTGTGTGSSDKIVTKAGTRANLNTSALQITGSPTSTKKFSNTVTVSGSLGDEYTFGGWVLSGSVPLKNASTPGGSINRRCGIQVRLLNGSTQIANEYVAVNDACHEWQFLSGKISAPSAYTKVEFSFVYDYNANTSWFDGAMLFRERFSYVLNHDSQGRITSVKDLDGKTTSYTYRGTTSDITSIHLPDTSAYNYTYSSSGLLQTAVSATNVSTAYTYNTWGSPTGTTISATGTKQIKSATAYTSDGNMTASVTGNDGYTYTYQNDTDRSLVTRMTNPRGNVTTYTYDNRRRLTGIQAASSCAITNTYADDRLVKIRHNNVGSNYTEFNLAYTKADLLSSVKVGSAYTLVQNTYHSSKWTLTKQSYGNGSGWKYEYNDFDQPIRRWTTGGSTGTEFKSFYNSEGRLARVEQYNTTLSGETVTGRTLLSTERYYYDTVNRLTCTRVSDSDGEHSFRWTYDSNNNVKKLYETINGRNFAYSHNYNADQQPTQTGYGGALKTFTYDALSRLSQTAVTWGGNPALTTSYGYKDRDTTRTTTQVATLQNVYGNTETFTYTYDNRGNIASVITSDSDGTHTTTYSYNFLNEMEWEYNEKEEKAWKYVSDKVGNITSKTEYTYLNGAVGSQISSVSYDYGNSNWRDLLTSYNGNTITYDGVGNPLSYRGWTFTWKGGRQLASASDGTTSLSFVYNNSGLRIKKTVGSTVHRYVYLGSRLAAEITDDYALYFHYDAKGSPMGFSYATAYSYNGYIYRKNLQGDIIGILNAAGNPVAEYRYDAWGRPLSTPTPGTFAAINPLRYRGYYYDQELGLYYLKSRYYDPEVCRFINADAFISTGQGIIGYNMFAYCGNNPVASSDPSGHYIGHRPIMVCDKGAPLSEKKSISMMLAICEITHSSKYSEKA